jgi:hypothetical protein
MTTAAILFFAAALGAQDDKPKAEEVVKKHEAALKAIEGVLDVSAGGTADDMRIMIRVNSNEAKAAVKKQVGEVLDGYKVYVYVGAPVGQTVATPVPEKPREPERTKPPPEADIEDCDIIRDHRKLKPITHHKGGKTVENCKLMHRQRIGGAGGHSFWYTKHRLDCPVRTGRVKMPKDADSYVQWIFTQGFLPAFKGSFLWPYEIKGSDKGWFEQVKDDLTSLLPYIREGAQWVKADEDKAGVGWKWQVQK